MKILLTTSRYPWPPRRGDQMRAVQMLDFLVAEHEVTLLAPAPGKDQPPPPAGTPYHIELYQAGGKPAALTGMTWGSFSSCAWRATSTTSARRRSWWT